MEQDQTRTLYANCNNKRITNHIQSLFHLQQNKKKNQYTNYPTSQSEETTQIKLTQNHSQNK